MECGHFKEKCSCLNMVISCLSIVSVFMSEYGIWFSSETSVHVLDISFSSYSVSHTLLIHWYGSNSWTSLGPNDMHKLTNSYAQIRKLLDGNAWTSWKCADSRKKCSTFVLKILLGVWIVLIISRWLYTCGLYACLDFSSTDSGGQKQDNFGRPLHCRDSLINVPTMSSYSWHMLTQWELVHF